MRYGDLTEDGASARSGANEGTALLSSRYSSIFTVDGTSGDKGDWNDGPGDSGNHRLFYRGEPVPEENKGALSRCWGRWAVTVLGASLMALFFIEAVGRKVIAANMLEFRWFLAQFLSVISFTVAVVVILPSEIRRIIANVSDYNSRIRSASQFSEDDARPLSAASTSKPAKWAAHFNAKLVSIGIMDSVFMSLLFVGLGSAPGPISCLLPQIVPTFSQVFDFACREDDQQGAPFRRNYGFRGGRRTPLVDTVFYHAFIFAGCLAASMGSAGRPVIDADASNVSPAIVKRDILLLVLAGCSAAGSSILKTRTLSRERLDIRKFHVVTSFVQVITGCLIAPLVLPLQDTTGRHLSREKRLPLPNFVAGLSALFSSDDAAPMMIPDVFGKYGRVFIFGSYLGAVWLGHTISWTLIQNSAQASADTAATLSVPLSMALFYTPIASSLGAGIRTEWCGWACELVILIGAVVALGASLALQIRMRRIYVKSDESPFLFFPFKREATTIKSSPQYPTASTPISQESKVEMKRQS
mmetsp:Transcript_17325/g.42420  ORF Transcript_17325/g.42420 Transcript_17325/m.42420 type:complete len:528 (-) Transcript_17325:406-1989(-)